MKLHYIFLSFLIISSLLFSCKKEGVKSPEFDVKTDKGTYKVGEQVVFNFSGNPNFISFYSGEVGNNYANRARTRENGKAIMQFTSTQAGGSQVGNLKIMISNDFSGVYDAPSIAKATWTDITNRAILSPGGTAGNNTPSGNVDLSDYAALNKPVYIGFYDFAPQNTLQPRGWTIGGLTINNTLTDKTIFAVVPNFLAAGFVAVDLQNPTYKWTITSTQMQVPSIIPGQATNEDWSISTAIDLNTVNPDYSIPIKGIDTRVANYSYVFKAAGTYTVTFLASNINVDDEKDIVKTLVLTINP